MIPSRKTAETGMFHFDSLLFGVCLGLLMIGYVMVASSSLHLGVMHGKSFMHYPGLQLLHIGLGLIFGVLVSYVPMRNWEKLGPWLLIIGFILLTVVLIPGLGVEVNHSRRWLSVFGVRLQVSEVFKFVAVIYMAGYISRHQKNLMDSIFGLIPPLILFGLASALLLKEPDLGSAVVIVMIAMGMMFLAGARLSSFIALFSVVTLMGVLLAYFEPYRWQRVVSYRNPWADPENTGFQLVQALISFGRGEWTGVGLGSGVQKLFYLPEAHTDFLFSVIGEELGLLGVVTVIILFALLIWHSFQIAMAAEKAGLQFSAYIAYGISIWLGFQSFVNMGVNMGVLPTKGLTLPLMSYGGSSMIMMCGVIGVLFRIHHETLEANASSLRGRSK
ncbi:MAG: putative lipid II flippase FtsW [Gammaproteobacteria bacterium]